jgi:DNA polymerase-3 subunit delta
MRKQLGKNGKDGIMILFLYGEDSYRSRQKLKQIEDRFKKSDKSRINFVKIDGERSAWREIEKEIIAPPFLHDKKLIVIENFLKKRGQKFEEAVEFLKKEKIPSGTVLVFYEENPPDERTAIFKFLNKPKQAERFNLLDPVRLPAWIVAAAEQRDIKIDRAAAGLLAELVGPDLWQASGELDKLAAYCRKSGKIGAEEVRKMVRGKFDENIFALTDAIAGKNKRAAFIILNEQIEAGLKETQIFFMLARQFRLLLQIKEIVAKNYSFLSPSDPGLKSKIAAELKLHPFVVQKTLQQIKNYSIPELKKIYKNLLDIDMKMKRTRTDPRLLLDLFFARVLS